MKRISSILFAVIMISALSFTSCSKYEEGSISLLPKTKRLVRTWTLKEFVTSTGSATSTTQATGALAQTVDFKDDNTFSVTMFLGTYTGEWEWNSDKTAVNIRTKDILGNWAAWEDGNEIRKLSSSELWTRDTDSNGDYVEYHFVSE